MREAALRVSVSRRLPPRAFAFDLDETIVDCEEHHDHATRVLFERRRLDPAVVRRVYPESTGVRTRDFMDAIREAAGMTEDLDELLLERTTAFAESVARMPPTPLPGAIDAVRACAAAGPTALVTSGHEGDVRATLAAIGLEDAFHEIITGEDVTHAKPEPEPYLAAAEALKVPPQELLAFEDSRRGVAAARAAGCWVVAVPNARSTTPDAVRADADVVLRSLEEALPLASLIAGLHG